MPALHVFVNWSIVFRYQNPPFSLKAVILTECAWPVCRLFDFVFLTHSRYGCHREDIWHVCVCCIFSRVIEASSDHIFIWGIILKVQRLPGPIAISRHVHGCRQTLCIQVAVIVAPPCDGQALGFCREERHSGGSLWWLISVMGLQPAREVAHSHLWLCLSLPFLFRSLAPSLLRTRTCHTQDKSLPSDHCQGALKVKILQSGTLQVRT